MTSNRRGPFRQVWACKTCEWGKRAKPRETMWYDAPEVCPSCGGWGGGRAMKRPRPEPAEFALRVYQIKTKLGLTTSEYRHQLALLLSRDLRDSVTPPKGWDESGADQP